ncbi:MAG: AlpA family phage regulatory protein [Gammaproteobacteria bacterium]|nr:AlpA family phage regulatory protein [Gammaproteobacteria bacterium]
MTITQQLFNATESAKILGFGRSEFYAKVRRGHLPQPIKIGPSSPRWRLRDLQAVIDGTWQPSKAA